ncbi:hypothetical protein ACVIWV_001882 [Bradyrhizobium diazoefficiens]
MTKSSVIPGRDEVASPESISPHVLRPDGFSGAQLRTLVRTSARPGMTSESFAA